MKGVAPRQAAASVQGGQEAARRGKETLGVVAHHRMPGPGHDLQPAARDGILHPRRSLGGEDVALAALDEQGGAAEGAHVVPEALERRGLVSTGAECAAHDPILRSAVLRRAEPESRRAHEVRAAVYDRRRRDEQSYMASGIFRSAMLDSRAVVEDSDR